MGEKDLFDHLIVLNESSFSRVDDSYNQLLNFSSVLYIICLIVVVYFWYLAIKN